MDAGGQQGAASRGEQPELRPSFFGWENRTDGDFPDFPGDQPRDEASSPGRLTMNAAKAMGETRDRTTDASTVAFAGGRGFRLITVRASRPWKSRAL